MRKGLLYFFLLALLGIGLMYLIKQDDSATEKNVALECAPEVDSSCFVYGFNPDSFHVLKGEIQPNEFLSDILLSAKVSYQTIHKLANNVKDVFDVRDLRAGGHYTMLCKDSCTSPDYFIYENSPYRYVVYDLQTLNAKVVNREIEKHTKTTGGKVKGSLWVTMEKQGLPVELIHKMEKALAWSVDFYHIQPNDSFRVVYEENRIEGNIVGVGQLKAAYFHNSDNEYFSIWYENGKYKGYYDECGRPMKGAFLKSPVEYARISSHYNPRRYHPVLKRVRPHLGTDYAAPTGTPIRAVADGLVIKASYTSGNGRYVKIKHDNVYTTQYLHMSRFGPGIRRGVHVKQGQTIGYVGSSGLATGPHVCFRFWKNGRQVNHLREYLPPPEPMAKAELPYYFKHRDKIMRQLGAEVVPEYFAENKAQENRQSEKISLPTQIESR
jgi:murein DD-endopeptidase MepM/ murein hydrolase activator NlpD